MAEKNTLSIVKIGGNIVDNPEALDGFLSDFHRLEGQKLLVHGGGVMATKLSAQIGIETKMIEGRRVTDEETLKLVTMVYAAGSTNNGSFVTKNGLQCHGFRVPMPIAFRRSVEILNR
jgi:acetylglutamate kinase